ncbi:sugar transferase [Oerskovia flava]|uniref:sugar transferase n=1 Tax=Oerskovia flava TaxID=2986422 RepID=UPI00223FC508|nr:sugar transferase [Oerskovia sp. JB1-3-2]
MSNDTMREPRRGLRQMIESARATTNAARIRAARAAFAATGWRDDYRRKTLLSDAAAVLVAVGLAYVLRFGELSNQPLYSDIGIGYVVLTVLIAGGWMLALTLQKSRDTRIIGSGPTEYQRVFDASWKLFAILTILAFATGTQVARGYLLFAFPVGLAGIFLGRYCWRQWLHAQRAHGRYKSAVLAIGYRDQAERLIRDLNDRDESGYQVVGVCIPTGQFAEGETVLGVPILGDLHQAGSIAAQVNADSVAVSGSGTITADVVRRLGWELEPRGVDLMLTAELADVAGPRITITPAETVALLHVDAPRFTGPKFVVKSVTDWLGAALLTIVLLPMLLGVAVAVAVTSRGPVFYTQDRVGRNGKTFPMYKFRSMRVGADAEVVKLEEQSDGAGPLFKMRNDPRVTPLGRILRRYSIDELPQILNVLRGDMSLVGPRPPLPREVSAYEQRMRRRLLVKPGLTGLWQVGGRSDLSWEQSVRLDVYYVENWTVFGDFLILARTARAVLSGSGAY